MTATMDGGGTNKSRNTGTGTDLATGQLVQRVRGDPQVLEVSGSLVKEIDGLNELETEQTNGRISKWSSNVRWANPGESPWLHRTIHSPEARYSI
jgi:hypothetical protein